MRNAERWPKGDVPPLAPRPPPRRAGAGARRGAVPLSARLLARRRLHARTGRSTLRHFEKAFELYSGDIRFTLFIVVVSTALIALISIAIAGVLTLGETPWLVTTLRWLYRWPLFIPFIVAAQCMRTFLAKNGLMNNTLVAAGLLDPVADGEPARLARHRHHLRVEAGAVRDPDARRRHGLARPRDDRGRAQPRRLALARARRDRAAAGRRRRCSSASSSPS